MCIEPSSSRNVYVKMLHESIENIRGFVLNLWVV
jgi:hypothetical protein